MQGATTWYAAHELHTPLHAIKSVAEMLLDGSMGRLAPEALEGVGLIADAVARLEAALAHLVEAETLTAFAQDARTTELAPAELLRAAGFAVEGESGTICQGDAAPLRRALALLKALLGPGAVVAVAVLDGACRLTLPPAVAPPKAGDGAILWRLLTGLLARAGATLDDEDGRAVIVLPLKSAMKP